MKLPVAVYRRAVQLGAFVIAAPWLVVGAVRCPYGVPFVSCLSCPVSNCRGVWLLPWALGALAASQLVRARSFCGWLCPMGLVQDAIGHLFARRGKAKSPRGARVDRMLRWAKYAAVPAVIVAVVLLNYPAERAHDYVVRSSRLLDTDAVTVALALGLARYPVRLALAALALVGAVVVHRFWCRYLCPLGAVLAVAKRVSFGRLVVDKNVCRQCGQCETICPMGTLPSSNDCISCYECVDVCGPRAIHSARKK